MMNALGTTRAGGVRQSRRHLKHTGHHQARARRGPGPLPPRPQIAGPVCKRPVVSLL